MWNLGPAHQYFAILITGFVIFVLIVFTIFHLVTSDKLTNYMGWPTRLYRKWLMRQNRGMAGYVNDIPEPPGGVRDEEVEALFRAGNLEGVEEMLRYKMEEARLAPVGSEAKIAVFSHYMEVLRSAGG